MGAFPSIPTTLSPCPLNKTLPLPGLSSGFCNVFCCCKQVQQTIYLLTYQFKHAHILTNTQQISRYISKYAQTMMMTESKLAPRQR